jgi:hypothetical protein
MASQSSLRFSSAGYLARVVYTLLRLAHILDRFNNFPVQQSWLAEAKVFDSLEQSELADHLDELTPKSSKFEYILDRVWELVPKDKKIVLLTRFPFVAVVLFLVCMHFFPSCMDLPANLPTVLEAERLQPSRGTRALADQGLESCGQLVSVEWQRRSQCSDIDHLPLGDWSQSY